MLLLISAQPCRYEHTLASWSHVCERLCGHIIRQRDGFECSCESKINRPDRRFLSGEPTLCAGQLEHSKQALENRGINLAEQTIFHVIMATYPFMSCLPVALIWARELLCFAGHYSQLIPLSSWKKSPRYIKQLHKVWGKACTCFKLMFFYYYFSLNKSFFSQSLENSLKSVVRDDNIMMKLK